MAIRAIVTADIVNSTLFTRKQEKRFREELTSILKTNRFEFYRGDSFQVLIKDPHEALRMVLLARTIARKAGPRYDVRCSIGIGEVNPYVKKLSTANDAAFILSGRSFDALGSSGQRLSISSEDVTINHGFNAISYFLDYLVKKMTEKQAEVIKELLNSNTQTKVAKKLRKSASTINKHALAAGWHEITKLLTEYDHLISILLNGNNLAD